ncbi:MAG: YfiR family protein [Thermoguttaceae bacterium]
MNTRWPPQSAPSRKVRGFGHHRIAIGAMLCMACAALPVKHASAQQTGEIDREYTIKGAFLYNFGRYVQWPGTAFADDHAPFVIGVLGTDPFGAVLDEIANSVKVDGRTVVAKRFATLAEYSPCHILFIAAAADAKVKTEVLAKLQNKGVLLVGEEAGLVQQGAVVNFYIENNKVRFEINVETAKQQQLKVSSKLLSLAKIVGTP